MENLTPNLRSVSKTEMAHLYHLVTPLAMRLLAVG